MINDKLKKIENEIETTENIEASKKNELLDLIRELKTEIVELSQENSEQAESIANFAGAMTHESTRQSPNSELKQISEKGLTSAVKEFEMTHPRLISLVNSISDMLSGIGI